MKIIAFLFLLFSCVYLYKTFKPTVKKNPAPYKNHSHYKG